MDTETYPWGLPPFPVVTLPPALWGSRDSHGQHLAWLGLCSLTNTELSSVRRTDLRQMFQTRSVENIQFLPFLTTDVNNLSWLSYGCLKQDWTLITVNTIGAALQTLYILVYFYFSPEKRRVLLQSVALLGVLILGYCYFNLLIPDVAVRLARLGLFCSVFTISMYLSPLADLAKIIRTRSTRCLSFPLTVATFLASASWTLYGFQLSDLYIMVPNIPGIVTSILRFWLFWQFPPDQDKLYKPLQA
ncbi:sugar transporter SWEET1 isoform X3 [Chrysemys picta bellii]|uniref:Sugar transporter SWEET n=2 Tax=Chrysemys picta bellii TaxID=8478 RepID=A0A8C3IRN3_CHRPI|nr:sugar transporter SWEET1 [Chrysemys picta bellii]